MKPDRFWQKELIEDCKSKRTLAIKFILPLVLLSPLAFTDMPAQVKAWILAVAVLFTGTFGSAVGLAQLKDSMMLEKLAVLPLGPVHIAFDYLLANVFMDGLQLMVPVVLIAGSIRSEPWVLVCYISAIIAANALGVLAAVMAESSAEVHLYSALIVLVAGAFSAPSTHSVLGPLQGVEILWPFWQLSNSMLCAWSGSELSHPVLAPLSAVILFSLALLLASVRLFRF